MRFSFLSGVGDYVIFLGRVLATAPKFFKRFQEFIIQFKRLGYDSVFLITLTAGFTGLVTALQALYQTKGFGSDDLVGMLIGKSTMIELAPVLTALVMTGRVGASIAAEIGTMKVSEQLDALQSMSIQPEEFLYMPRILAGLLAFPILTVYADIVGIFSSWLYFWQMHGLHYVSFFNSMRGYFEKSDLISGIVKSIVFGFIITSMGCYFGSRTTGGAEGVGRSTTQAVVYSAVLILVMDFFVAWFVLGL